MFIFETHRPSSMLLLEREFDVNAAGGPHFILAPPSSAKKNIERAEKFFKETGYDSESTRFYLEKEYDAKEDADKDIIYTFGAKPDHILKVIVNDKETGEYVHATRSGYFKHPSGQQQNTTIHELATGIYILDPKISLTTYDKFLKAVSDTYDNVKIQSLQQYRSVFDKSTLEDAHSLAVAFRNKMDSSGALSLSSVSKVGWFGPTAATTSQIDMTIGAADIVLRKKPKDIPISIKMGHGQLKNPSVKAISKIISKKYQEEMEKLEELTGSRAQFLDVLHNMNPESMDALSRNYIGMFKGTSLYGDNAKALSAITGWKEYKQFAKLNKVYATKLSNAVYSDPGRKKAWQAAKKEYLVKPIADLIGSALDSMENEELEPTLRTLYENIFTLIDEPYYYLAEGGKKILRVPSKDEFELLSKRLTFIHQTTDKPGPYFSFTIIVQRRSEEEKIPLLKLDVRFRWAKGQMLSDLDVKVAPPVFLVEESKVIELLFPIDEAGLKENLIPAYDMLKRMNRYSKVYI